MEAVTITLGAGAYVPASIRGEPIWQPPVSTVYGGTTPRVVITGTRSELVLSTGTVDVSTDVPAAIADDHAALVAWWSGEVERQEAEAETARLEARGMRRSGDWPGKHESRACSCTATAGTVGSTQAASAILARCTT